MKTEQDFTHGEEVQYISPHARDPHVGKIDYSYGEEKPGFVRIENADGIAIYVPAGCIK